ncbi:MAG: hypothetical protein P4L63_00725 [Candidatus Pacebacteria bacterium]|nr:hypothetical protein [Candidatus Paceibacterota bacterium]
MFDSNHIMKAQEEQRIFTKKDFDETILQLKFLKQEIYRLGNNSSETSEVEELIKKFQNGEISKKEALEAANTIIYKKEAGIDSKSGGH